MKSVILFIIFYKLLYHFGVTNVVDDIFPKLHQNEYKVTMERTVAHYVNKSLLEYEIKSFVYNRTIKATNYSFLVYNDYNRNDLRALIVAKKFVSNEYRPFPMRFEMNLCKSLDENVSGFATGFNCGNFTGCPIKKNIKYFTCNTIVESDHYPPLVPPGRYLFEMSILDSKHTLLVVHAFHNIVYQPKLLPRDKPKSG